MINTMIYWKTLGNRTLYLFSGMGLAITADLSRDNLYYLMPLGILAIAISLRVSMDILAIRDNKY